MNRKKMRSSFLLLLTAFIWGTAFVAQSVGMEYVGAFTFNMCRFLLGGAVLLPAVLLMVRRVRQTHPEGSPSAARRSRIRDGIKGGLACGVVLFVASSFQQIGISMTTVGKSGFITALYIVLVPVCGVFMKKRIPRHVWLGVALATAGMYLLCVTESFTINRGDMYLFFCALSFTVHILVIDRVSPRADGILISCVQFFTAGVLSAVLTFLFETPRLAAILFAVSPILYSGVLSCGVAYTLQVIAQKDTDPTVASLLMSLESVFSLLAGWVILHQRLSARELSGCALVFAAVILAQLPARE